MSCIHPGFFFVAKITSPGSITCRSMPCPSLRLCILRVKLGHDCILTPSLYIEGLKTALNHLDCKSLLCSVPFNAVLTHMKLSSAYHSVLQLVRVFNSISATTILNSANGLCPAFSEIFSNSGIVVLPVVLLVLSGV